MSQSNTASSFKTRFKWVDYAKGIGIILVVAAHNLGGQRNAGLATPPSVDALIAYAYSFHMPLFFLLSGLFVERSYQKGFSHFISSKLKTVFYPFLLWSIIQGTLTGLLSRFTNHPVSLAETYKFLLITPVGQMWFLYALFWMFMAYALMRLARIKPDGVIFLALVTFFACLFVPRGFIYSVLYNLSFFSLGVVGRDKIHQWLDRDGVASLFFMATTISAIHLVLLFGIFHGIRPTVPVISFLLAVIGIASIVVLCVALAKNNKLEWLKLIGEYSLAIFLMHTILGSGTRIVLQKFLKVDDPWVHAFLGLFSGVVLPLMIGIVTRKWRWDWLFEWPSKKLVLATATMIVFIDLHGGCLL